MQTVYIASVVAAHDFNSLALRRVFASRVVAHRWAYAEAQRLNDEAKAHDGWDGYDFRTELVSVEFDPSEAAF